MRSRDEIEVVSDQLGTPTWVMTLASSLLTMIDHDVAGTRHLTDSGVASWYDFAVAIREISQDIGLLTHRCVVRPIRTTDFPTPARRPAYGGLDKTSTFELLGEPTPHWRESLARCLSQWSDPT
jgi:dTDP-4-dehydrorhamnose reductase